MATQIHNAAQMRRARPRPGLFTRLAMGGGVILALCLIAAVIAAIVYMLWDDPNLTNRPLVLIHSPINRQRLSEGDSVLVHTTARSPAGIQRIELWADDTLIAQRQAEPGAPSDTMVLSADWIPLNTGSHRLIARATSADKIDGQASIMIETTETDEAEATGNHTVQEGETLDTIAGAYGATPDDLAALNPGIDPGNLAPGSEVVVPGDEPSAEGESPSDSPLPTDSEPPSAMAEPPSGMFSLPLDRPGPQSDEPTGLRMELISLRTGVPYESLSCYIGMAGATPMRYPDADRDQTTDESFAIIGLTGTSWNVGEYLGGDSMPMILWPANQPIPFSISCVGISGGGTQALQLGSTELAIPPGQWDGITRRLEVVGAEGSFTIGYQVSGIGGNPHGEPIWLDSGMTPPTDLIVASYNAMLGPELSDDYLAMTDKPFVLLWHYRPQLGEAIPDGFRVYLNGVLQWTERADRRSSDWYRTVFPPQWRHPPCGEQYMLTVSAWRSDPSDPEGVESRTANPPIIFSTPPGECDRHVMVSFESLEIFSLGRDDDHDAGLVGPPYGTFFANDQLVTFDTGDIPSPWQGVVGSPLDLSSNTLYSLTDSTLRRNWHFAGRPYFVVAVSDEERLEIGYEIMDEDRGPCEEPSDIGCDDHICEGLDSIGYFHNDEGTLISTNGVCRVNYTHRLRGDSPVGSVGDNTPPLPWLSVGGVWFDDDGNVHVRVRNSGSADWSMHDLTIELQRPTGEYLGRYTWPDFSLARDQQAVLEHPDMHVDMPYEACALVDPDNVAKEEYDDAPEFWHNYPVCSPRPDLEITNVIFDGDTDGLVRVTVQNVGTEPLLNRTVGLNMYGAFDTIDFSQPNVSLDVGEPITLDVPVSEDTRAPMSGPGYTVIVNEDNLISETDTSNNSYTVGPGSRLFLTWCDRMINHVTGWNSSVHMYFTADVLSGESAQRVADESWFSTLSHQEAEHGHNHLAAHNPGQMCARVSNDFQIAGDQWLRLTFSADYQVGATGPYESIGSIEVLHAPEDRWDGAEWPPCHADPDRPEVSAYFILPEDMPGTWYTIYDICEMVPSQ